MGQAFREFSFCDRVLEITGQVGGYEVQVHLELVNLIEDSRKNPVQYPAGRSSCAYY
jgi:hypothetical protein